MIGVRFMGVVRCVPFACKVVVAAGGGGGGVDEGVTSVREEKGNEEGDKNGPLSVAPDFFSFLSVGHPPVSRKDPACAEGMLVWGSTWTAVEERRLPRVWVISLCSIASTSGKTGEHTSTSSSSSGFSSLIKTSKKEEEEEPQ